MVMTSAAPGYMLTGSPDDFDPVLRLIGNARFALISEASRGTHEFYRIRTGLWERGELPETFPSAL